jgi:DNA polymerase-3 subunit alpha
MSDNVRVPKKFVNLHGHSVLSLGDGLNMPRDHMDFALENGLDDMALTDHGHMNGFSHQYLYQKELDKKGINFKSLFGNEAYFIDSLKDWSQLYASERERKALEKQAKKEKEISNKVSALIGENAAPHIEDLETTEQALKNDEDTEGESVIENEDESKFKKFDPLKKRNHLVLVAKNGQGLKSLFKCTSMSYVNGFYKYPRMDFDLLKENAKGNIIALSACVGGRLASIVFDNQIMNPDTKLMDIGPNDTNFEKIQKELKAHVERFQDTFGYENYYLELQFNKLPVQHLVNMHLIECAKRTGAKLVVTCDSHYARPEFWREREIYKAMSQLQLMKNPDAAGNISKTVDELKCELYPKNAEQLWKSYKDTTSKFDFYSDEVVCDAIERTYDIAHNQIETIKVDTSIKLPAISRIIPKEDLTILEQELGSLENEDDIAFAQLRKEVIKGAQWRKVDDKDEYIARLKHELGVIKHLKIAKYFLTYSKIMTEIGKKTLTGPGRGSAAASMVAYVLNITQIDPIKFDLLFDRFLSKKKAGWPDIDSDSGDRIVALEVITKLFGEENVIAISNFTQLQARSLIKDLARLDNIPFDAINKYTSKIEMEALAEAKKTPGFDAQQWVLTYDEAEANSPSFRELMQKYPQIDRSFRVLFKQMRNVSRHAGGVLITEKPFDNMPVIKSGKYFQTPWTEGLNFRHLEPFGFLKFDILGLGTLQMFENCIRRILKKQGKKFVTFDMIKDFYYQNVHPDNNKMDDQKVYENVYHNNNYIGIFQFVNPQVQKFTARFKPTSIDDLAIITSVFRPGPLGLGADKILLKNKMNPDEVVYRHPLLKPVFEKTYGNIIFQEQLQIIYNQLAGVPIDETDSVRKAFTKKDISNKEKSLAQIRTLRDEFITKCKSANNIDEKLSGAIFDDVEKFVSYSFNKAHAVSYATVSYQCAWFLTYYPDEWVATYIDYCITEKGKASGKEDPKAVAISEAKALGYRLSKADINHSGKDTEVKDGVIIPSFESLKGVGATAVQEIQRFRPYKSVEDLLWIGETWKHSKFNKRALETLVCLEALDSLDLVGPDKTFKNYKQLYHVVVENNDKLKRAISKKKKDHKEVLEKLIEEAQSLEDWAMEEKINFSQELTGSIDINLIVTQDILDYFKKAGIRSVDQWDDEEEYYWAVVDSCKIASTSTGKKYCRLNVYGDSMEKFNCSIWNYNERKDKPLPPNMLIIAKFKKNNFGLSCSYGQLEILERAK